MRHLKLCVLLAILASCFIVSSRAQVPVLVRTCPMCRLLRGSSCTPFNQYWVKCDGLAYDSEQKCLEKHGMYRDTPVCLML